MTSLTMLSLLVSLLLPVSSPAAKPSNPLILRDPTFYDVLPKNSRVTCRYMRDANFGLLLERGDSEAVKVSLITNGVNEGEKSAFRAEIKKISFDSIVIRHYRRQDNTAQFHEIKILRRRSYEFNYGLPAMISSMSAIYSKGEDGTEKEDLYPDGNFRISCEVPLLRR